MNAIPLLALNLIFYHGKQKLFALPFAIVPFIHHVPYKILTPLTPLTWVLCCCALPMMIKD
jgi:hypothetical protein